MKCNHKDCFTCPHPDCILDEGEAVVDPVKLEERRRKRKEYDKQYYQLHKAELAEKRKIAYKRKKAGKFI